MTISIVRLTSGEELICNVKEHDKDYDSFYYLTDVAIIIPTRENSLALAPFLPYSMVSHSGINIKKDSVMFTVEPHADLLNRYQEIFSKIITPSSEIMMNQ